MVRNAEKNEDDNAVRGRPSISERIRDLVRLSITNKTEINAWMV